MKKILFILFVGLAFIGCSEEDERSVIITNATGIDLYEATINSLREKEGPTHRAPESLGLFENGTTKKVSFDSKTHYFSIFAKTKDGKLAYTKRISASSSTITIYPYDMLD